MNYAAFVITYERAEILEHTIKRLFEQTHPPSHVLVVDNSSTDSAERMIERLDNGNISYRRTGYNAGPAEAAGYGMSKLVELGFEWILWVDDDDPPEEATLIERLIRSTEVIRRTEKVGILGTVGSDFNFRTGELRRITNDELLSSEFIEVKQIAGNMFPLINAEVIRKGALPNKHLFFGFEELDFCLKVHHLGYKLIVPAEIMSGRRKESGRWNYQVNKVSLLKKAQSGKLWREYYSIRNMTYLFSHTYPDLLILLRYVAKFSIKVLLSYSKGVSFGWLLTKYTVLGFTHGVSGKLGKTIMPEHKY